MNKKIFKVLALVLVVVIGIVAMAACGQQAPTKDNTKFVIGGSGPLTGGAAVYGIAVKNAAQLAVDEINAAGGLNGVNFELNFKDDMAEADKATAAYSILYDAGMNVSMGSVTTGSCIAFAKQAAKDNVFFMTPSASGDDAVTDDSAYRVCFGDPDQGEATAKYFNTDEFKTSHPGSKIGVIYKNDDAYSKGIYDAFMANKGDIEVVTTSFDENSKINFEANITQIKSCNILVLPIYYSEAILILKEAKAQHYAPQVYGCDGLDGIEGEAKKTDFDVTGVNYFTPFDADSTDANIVKFVTSYKNAYNEVPNQFAADAYDAVYILYNLMKKANLSDPTMSASDITNLINPLMTEFNYDGLTGKDMTWSADGHCHKAIQVKTIG